MVEKIVILLYLISHIFIAAMMILKDNYIGTPAEYIKELKINEVSIFLLLVLIILGYLFLFIFYKITRKNKIFRNKIPIKFDFNKTRFHIFIFILVFSQLLYAVISGRGVGNQMSSSISSIFSFFRVNSIFPFYYIIAREKKKIYFTNIILFFIYQLILGWSFFIFKYVIIELFLYFRKRRNNIRKRLSNIRLLFHPIILLLTGAKVYQYIYPFKMYIRSGNFKNISYIDSFIKLITRLSYFSLSVSVFQNMDLIKSFYNDEKIFLKEILAMFRPLVPSFIMPIKNFRPINNVVVQAIFPNVSYTTSSNVGLISYFFALFNSDFLTAISWIFMIIILYLIVTLLISLMEQHKGQLDIIYFLLLLSIYQVNAIEQVFSYQYLTIFFIIPFMLFFKVINIKKYHLKYNL